MFNVFGDLFDLNNDGHIDPAEQTIEFMIDDMTDEDDESEDDADDDID